MFLGDLQPAVPGGFPDGMRVLVISGQYDGDVGVVVNRAPDLRPGSVWSTWPPPPPGPRLSSRPAEDGHIPVDDHAMPEYDTTAPDRPRL